MTERNEQAQRAYDDAEAEEIAAWGDPARDNPVRRERWDKASEALTRASHRLLTTTSAEEDARRAVARLSNPAELTIRVALARERLVPDGG